MSLDDICTNRSLSQRPGCGLPETALLLGSGYKKALESTHRSEIAHEEGSPL